LLRSPVARRQQNLEESNMSKVKSDKAVQAAIHNLAVLILKSSSKGKLIIEFKNKAKIGKMTNGVDADEMIDTLAKSLGVPQKDQSGLIAHINGTPIGDDMLPALMKTIGDMYLMDHASLKLKNIA
jgi:hypothetical protein